MIILLALWARRLNRARLTRLAAARAASLAAVALVVLSGCGQAPSSAAAAPTNAAAERESGAPLRLAAPAHLTTAAAHVAEALAARLARAVHAGRDWSRAAAERALLAAAAAHSADPVVATDALIRVPARLTATSAVADPVAVEAVYFPLSSARLSAGQEAALDALIVRLRSLAGAGGQLPAIELLGHADRVGSADANHVLSRARAVAVRRALARRLDAAGIAPAGIEIRALGETAPAVSTADGVAEPMNRRVEIRLALTQG